MDSYGIAILVLLYVDDHGVTWSSYGDTHRECYTEVHMHQHFNAQIHMCIPTFMSIYNPTLKLSICQKFKSGGGLSKSPKITYRNLLIWAKILLI